MGGGKRHRRREKNRKVEKTGAQSQKSVEMGVDRGRRDSAEYYS